MLNSLRFTIWSWVSSPHPLFCLDHTSGCSYVRFSREAAFKSNGFVSVKSFSALLMQHNYYLKQVNKYCFKALLRNPVWFLQDIPSDINTAMHFCVIMWWGLLHPPKKSKRDNSYLFHLSQETSYDGTKKMKLWRIPSHHYQHYHAQTACDGICSPLSSELLLA